MTRGSCSGEDAKEETLARPSQGLLLLVLPALLLPKLKPPCAPPPTQFLVPWHGQLGCQSTRASVVTVCVAQAAAMKSCRMRLSPTMKMRRLLLFAASATSTLWPSRASSARLCTALSGAGTLWWLQLYLDHSKGQDRL